MWGNNRGLFGWRTKYETEAPQAPKSARSVPAQRGKRVVCFRIDDDLDRRLSRALHGQTSARSEFIRAAIERVLKEDGEEHLRKAHSAITWG
jgi:hypothetical protein